MNFPKAITKGFRFYPRGIISFQKKPAIWPVIIAVRNNPPIMIAPLPARNTLKIWEIAWEMDEGQLTIEGIAASIVMTKRPAEDNVPMAAEETRFSFSLILFFPK